MMNGVMRTSTENRLADFGWGCFCGAVAALLVFTAGYFLHNDQAGLSLDQMSLSAWAAFVPWWWTLGIAALFGLLNTRRNRHRARSALDALDAVDFVDFGN